MAAAAEHTITIDPAPVAPGGVVCGRVAGPSGVEVTLLRLERSPAGTVVTIIGEPQIAVAGEFRVEVPAGAAPSASGEGCAIAYVVRATHGGRGGPRAVSAELPVGGRLQRVHLAEQRPAHDRWIARHDGRRVRIELSEADVQGGGRVAGRVHQQQGRRLPAAVSVSCRCLESWRVNGRRTLRKLNEPPLWSSHRIWSAQLTLDWPAGQTWAPFAFALPVELPPAVEARSIAWRYEVEARGRVWLALDDVAVATPIGFELTPLL